LAWFEARRLVLHPLFLGTLLFSLLAWGGLFIIFSGEEEAVSANNDDSFAFVAIAVLGLFALLLAANRNLLRSRRDGTSELLATLPTAPRTRTTAALLAGWLPGLAIVAASTLSLLLFLWRISGLEVVRLNYVGLAGVYVLALGAVTAGVLVARWVPLPLAGAAGVVLLILVNNQFDHLHPRWRWIRFAPEPDFGGRYDIRPDGWHLLFVVALLVLGVGLALARHGLDGRVAALVLAGVVGAVTAGWVSTRPPSAAAVADRVARLENPRAYEVCETTGIVEYCSWPDATEWVPVWREAVEGVLAAVPEGRRPASLAVVQRTESTVYDDLLPEVRAQLRPDVAWSYDGVIHPGDEMNVRVPHLTVAYMTASELVGLPGSLARCCACDAGGQARGMIAMWLTAQADPANAEEIAERLADGEGFITADAVPDYEGLTSNENIPHAASYLHQGDAAGALALLQIPTDEVMAALDRNWDALLDPATHGADVFGWLGREAPAQLVAVEQPALRGCR
jgi:hypothetical protein